jgi:hypothetical protein
MAPASGHGSDTVLASAGGVSGAASVTFAQAPIITSMTANPSPVTGKTTQLAVTATDPNGVGGLIYNWTLLSGPAGVTFGSNNNTLAIACWTVTFTVVLPAAPSESVTVTKKV